MNDYILKEEIGKGNMSIVYKGRKKRTINFYAIYSIEKAKRPRVLNNVSVLRGMSHESIIQFHNWYETANHLWVITELCVGGDLRSILAHNNRMSATSVRLLGSDIATGLLYIHSKGFLYRDLKPANLLMDSTAMLRFYDFGLACVFGAASEKSPMGTPLYMAPELFITGGVGANGPVAGVPSIASDLWSLGCVLYEMAAGESPFAGKTLEEVLRNVFTKQPPKLAHMSDSFNDLVRRLLEKDPLKRATWKELCASGFWEDAAEGLKGREMPPREPAFDAYRREVENAGTARSGRAGAPWSEEEINAAVQGAVAAAMANLASSPAFNEEEEGFGEVNPGKEVDFTAAAAMTCLPTASADAVPTRRSTGTVTSVANSRTQPGSPHTPQGTYVGSNDTTGDLSTMARKQTNNFTAGGAARPGSLASNQGTNNGSRAGSPRPSNFFASGERLTKAQVEEIAGNMLGGTNVCDLVWHNSDSNTRPLYGNARIEKHTEPAFDSSGFTFKALKRNELKDLDERPFSSFIRSVYKQLSSDSSDPVIKRNILNYVETIASETNIANMLVNSSIMTLCIDQMEATTTLPSALRAAAASVAGMLVRYAFQISALASRTNVIPRLLRLFQEETNIIVKRKVFVCLGELVFYVYTQDESERGQWGIVPEELERVFVVALEINDDLIRHFAAKTIENLSTSYDKAAPVCTARIVEGLLTVFDLPPGPTRNHHMRSSALCAALRLATWREELIPVVLKSDCLPLNAYGNIAASSPIPRTSQVLLAFVIVTLVKAMTATKNAFALAWASLPDCSGDAKAMLRSTLKAAEAEGIINSLAEISEDLTEKLCENNERLSASLRGKTLLFYVILGCLGGTVLPKMCTSRNLASLDRTVRDEDAYIKQCREALSSYLSVYVSEKLGSVARRPSSTTAPVYLASVQQILNAGSLRGLMDLQADAFKSLAEGLQKAMSNSLYSTYEEDFNTLADRITQSPDSVVQYHEPICTYLVPVYTEMLQRKDSPRRFSALRFLVSVTAPLSTDSRVPRDSNGAATGSLGRAVTSILSAVSKALPALLAETNPVPSYTLRLLATGGECSPTALNAVLSTASLSSVMTYLSSSSTEGDLFYPLKLLLIALTNSNSEEYISLVVKQKLLSTVVKALRSAMGTGMDHVLEVGCELSVCVLTRATTGAAATSRLGVQCSGELMEGDSLGTVFIPLTTADYGSATVNEKAAQVVYNLARLSTAAQTVMLSSRGIACLSELLRKDPLNAATVEWMLKAVRLAAEPLRKADVQQRLGGQEGLLGLLEGDAIRSANRSVSAEAARLVRLIKE